MGFEPNLHQTDWRYSVKNYFIGFARKYFPTLIYKQIKFVQVFANSKQAKIILFSNKTFQYTSMFQNCKICKNRGSCKMGFFFNDF